MSNLIILLALGLFAGMGYWRGALKIGADIFSLFVASFFAWLVPGLGSGLLGLTGLVPKLLCPVLGPIALGVTCYAFISIGLSLYLKRRPLNVENPEKSSTDRIVGAALGIVWGSVMLTLIISGLVSAGRTQRAVRIANAELDYRQNRRQVEFEKNKRMANLTHQPVQPVSPKIDFTPVRDLDLKMEPESEVEKWGSTFEKSILAPAVERVAPVNARVENTLRRVQVMLVDPVLFERFQSYPEVVALKQDPTLVALSKDPQIVQLLTQRQYRELMDHPKVTALLREEELVRKLKQVDIERISLEVVNPGGGKQ